jgi:NADH:ubiquinone oxidoreductase subunit 2 (subunit N)
MNDSILETIVNDSQLAMPLLLWPVLAIVLLVVQIINPRPKLALGLSLAGLLGMIGFSVASFDSSAAASLFVGTVAWDPISQSFNILTQLIVLSVVLMMVPGLSSTKGIFQDGYEQLPEFLICLILSGFGAGVLVSAKDLTSLFLGLEIL